MAWAMLSLPAVLVVFIFYSILQNARRSQTMAERSVDRFEDHRQFTEEHMKRVETQMDRLDKRLSRVIDLLEAIEQGQRRDRA
jgi:hypothetical protein